MKRLIGIFILLLCSQFVNAACKPQPPYYNGSNKTNAQAAALYPQSRGYGYPVRASACEDWWYIWTPDGVGANGQYYPAGWKWLSDGGAFSAIEFISTLSPYGQVIVRPPRPFYSGELNSHIQLLVNSLSSRGLWWAYGGYW